MSDDKRVIISKQYLTDMGNAIRNKLGDYTKTYKPSEMAEAIRSIQTNTFVTSFLHDKTALYSGTIGTCSWEISTKGVLFIYAGVLPEVIRGKCEAGKDFVVESNRQYSPWYDYRSWIKLVSFEGPVVAGTDISYMFAGLEKLWLINSLSYLNMTKSVNISFMFQNCKGLAGVDFSINDFTNVQNMSYIFNGCSQIMEIKFPDIRLVDYHCGYDVKNLAYAFAYCPLLPDIDITFLDEGNNITSMECIFDGDKALETVITRFDRLNKLTSLKYAFRNCEKLTTIDIKNWTTTNALTTLESMFENCIGLTILDLSNIDISGATGLKKIFNGCTSLEEIKTDNGWVFSAGASVEDMFSGSSARLNTRKWDVSALGNFNFFFKDWKGDQELDFTLWDTSNATTMKGMFQNCVNLIKINLFSFEPINCTDMSYMFSGCTNLTLDNITFFYDFDSTKEKLKNVSYMFNNCISFTEFHFTFNTYSVTNYACMLFGCYKIQEIDFSTWFLHGDSEDDGSAKKQAIEGKDMLSRCTNLKLLSIGNSYFADLFKPTEVQTYISAGAIVDIYTYHSPGFPVYMYEVSASIEIDPDSIWDQDEGIPTGLKDYYGCGALTTGIEFNNLIKALVSGTTYNANAYSNLDSNVKIFDFKLATAEEELEFFENDSKWIGIGTYYNKAGVYASWDEESATVSIVTGEKFMLFNKDSSHIFQGFKALETINFSYINTRSITDLTSAFHNCQSITSIDLNQFYTKRVQSMASCFMRCFALEQLDLTYFETDALISIESICSGDTALSSITFFNQATEKALNAKEAFIGCSNLTTFNQPTTDRKFIFSDLDGCFRQCTSLTNLTLNNWDISTLSHFIGIFSECTNLEVLDIEDWEFNNNIVTTLKQLFMSCINLYSIKFNQSMPAFEPKDVSRMFYHCEKLGTKRELVNGEYTYTPDTFKLPKMKLMNTSTVATERVNASELLAGCKGIKTLDLSGLQIITTESLDISNLLTADQKNISTWDRYNIDNYVNTNFSNVYDSENDLNEVTLTCRGGYEKLVKRVSVIAQREYTAIISFKTPTGFRGNARYYITNNPSNYQGGISGYISNSGNFSTNPSEVSQEYVVNFNSGNNTIIYFIIYLAEVSDGYEFKYHFSNIGLYRNNANMLPNTTDFLTAQSGSYGGYALDTIITGPAINAYFQNNNAFTTRPQTASLIRYINSNSEEFYSIPPNIADAYTISYL